MASVVSRLESSKAAGRNAARVALLVLARNGGNADNLNRIWSTVTALYGIGFGLSYSRNLAQ